jgi:uncharacterized membrane protein
MPDPATIPLSVVAYTSFLACLIHAARRGAAWPCILVSASVFGLIIEHFDMRTGHTYHYGNFDVMLLGDVPLAIATSWGAIIYAAMWTSDRLQLRWYLRPIYDGLLALTIDLSLDPVAIPLGWWTWTMVDDPLPWFGAPLENFFGWFDVVLAFSFMVRLGFRVFPASLRGGWRDVVVAAAALPLAFVPFFALLLVYAALMYNLRVPEPLVFTILLGGAVLLIVRYLPTLPHDRPVVVPALMVPLAFHGLMLAMLFGSGLFGKPPLYQGHQALVLLIPTVAFLSLVLFAWPSLDTIERSLEPSWPVVATAPVATVAPPVSATETLPGA